MSNNVEVVRELFRAVQARDLQALLACYDEDVEIREDSSALLRFLSQPAEAEGQAATPMLLVADLTVTDPDAMLRYATKVQPVMARYGGRIAGVSATGAEVLEGDWNPQLLVWAVSGCSRQLGVR